MKIAIVGLGQIADAHICEIKKIKGCKVVGICDKVNSILTMFSQRHGIKNKYTEFKTMLKETEPDVVHITTPPPSHFSLGKEAIRQGCSTYIEKPFTLSLNETEELITLANKKKVKLCVGTDCLYYTAMYKAMEFVKKGKIGRVTHIETVMSYDLTGIFGKVFLSNPSHWVNKLPGKLFQNIISHPLSAIVPFIGDTYKTFAWASDFSENGMVSDELRLQIFNEKEKITASLVFTSNIKPATFQVRYYGTKKSVYFDNILNTLSIEKTPSIPSRIGELIKIKNNITSLKKQLWHMLKGYFTGKEQYFSGMNRMISTFYDSIKHNTQPPVSYTELRRTAKIMDEMIVQLRRK